MNKKRLLVLSTLVAALLIVSLQAVSFAESDNYEMVESNIYFPPESVNWQYLQKSGEKFSSPLIGEGTFYTINIEEIEKKNAAWSFPEPEAEFTHIRDYVTFSYGEVNMQTERSG